MRLNSKRKLINAEKEPFCPVNSPAFDEVTFTTSNKNDYENEPF